MSCFHPLNAYQGPVYNENGKQPEGCRLLKVPCGQCDGCRMAYGKEWAIRCVLEAKQWEHNYFVTLTYDDAFVPLNSHYVFDDETGEVIDEDFVMTLFYKDLQDFNKRLRINFKRHKHFPLDLPDDLPLEDENGNFIFYPEYAGLRFYACGEYGPLNMRPHFHAILFNCPLDDLKLHHRANGYCYYESEFLNKAWSKKRTVPVLGKDGLWHNVGVRDENGEFIYDQLGYVQVTDFTYETAAYVARYMLKKHKGLDADFYEQHGIAPEQSRMSRRPGIAATYYEENRDLIYEFDQINILGGKGKVMKAHPPKYFDRLFDVDNPEQMSMIKEKRKDDAVRSMQEQLKNTNLNEAEYLAVKEANFRSRISKLQRSL